MNVNMDFLLALAIGIGITLFYRSHSIQHTATGQENPVPEAERTIEMLRRYAERGMSGNVASVERGVMEFSRMYFRLLTRGRAGRDKLGDPASDLNEKRAEVVNASQALLVSARRPASRNGLDGASRHFLEWSREAVANVRREHGIEKTYHTGFPRGIIENDDPRFNKM